MQQKIKLRSDANARNTHFKIAMNWARKGYVIKAATISNQVNALGCPFTQNQKAALDRARAIGHYKVTDTFHGRDFTKPIWEQLKDEKFNIKLNLYTFNGDNWVLKPAI